MSKRFIVALDEGTTSARAAVYDLEQGKFVRVVNQPFGQIYPRPGWVEQDLNELYAAQVAAGEKGMDPQALVDQARANACRLFGICRD